MAGAIGSNTASGLIEYLDSLVVKGRSRPGVVGPLKTAITKVLEKTEGDNWSDVNVTDLDIDDLMARFKNLTLGVYDSASYRAYESRIKRAAGWYRQFLVDPGWTPKSGDVREKDKAGVTAKKTAIKHPVGTDMPTKGNIITVASSTEAAKSEGIPYPFPLANGQIARIFMPSGLTVGDVERMTLFLKALVIDSGGQRDDEHV